MTFSEKGQERAIEYDKLIEKWNTIKTDVIRETGPINLIWDEKSNIWIPIFNMNKRIMNLIHTSVGINRAQNSIFISYNKRKGLDKQKLKDLDICLYDYMILKHRIDSYNRLLRPKEQFTLDVLDQYNLRYDSYIIDRPFEKVGVDMNIFAISEDDVDDPNVINYDEMIYERIYERITHIFLKDCTLQVHPEFKVIEDDKHLHKFAHLGAILDRNKTVGDDILHELFIDKEYDKFIIFIKNSMILRCRRYNIVVSDSYVAEIIIKILSRFFNDTVFINRDISHFEKYRTYVKGMKRHKQYVLMYDLSSYNDINITKDPHIYCTPVSDLRYPMIHIVISKSDAIFLHKYEKIYALNIINSKSFDITDENVQLVANAILRDIVNNVIDQ